jgi:hypothetical protein
MRPFKTGTLVVALVCTLGVAGMLAHDFWLIPNAFSVAPGSDVIVLGRTSSTFPTTLSAVTPDRIAHARLLLESGAEDITSLSVQSNSLRLERKAPRVGQALVVAAILPRSVPESPESFRQYLRLEGAPEALARYEREGLLPTTDIVRRYAKYAKTLIQIGRDGPRAFGREAGHPLEFVPLSDPAAVGAGGSLRFRVQLFGRPLAGARGHASVATSAASDRAHHEATFESDAKGEFTVALASAGLWNVRALYILPAPSGSGADWDVHWATFVWGIGGPDN